MRIRNLFRIPEGERITENVLRRVLLSSVCSILLCMTCLVSTTWAWFTVSVENTGNVIEIAEVKADVTVSTNGTAVEPQQGSYTLSAESVYVISAKLTNTAIGGDAFGAGKKPVYLVVSVAKADTTESYFVKVENDGVPIEQKLKVGGEAVSISFSVSWVQPAGAKQVTEEVLLIDRTPPVPSESASQP